MLPEVGEIIRLDRDVGRFQAGEFFVCLDPEGPKGLMGFVTALASDGNRTALERRYLQRWREYGGWGATVG
jgi:hypothetical protein